MPALIQISDIPDLTGQSVRARVTLPGGTALAEFPLVESADGIYSGTFSATIADTGALQLQADIRRVTAQTSVSFDASTILLGGGPIGFVNGGNLIVNSPGDVAAIAAAIPKTYIAPDPGGGGGGGGGGLGSIDAALTQYNSNLPWYGSLAAASACLAAVQYLMINRAQRMGDRGSDLNYESLAAEKAALEKFLGATAPRSFGRSRFVAACFGGPGSIS